MKPYCLTAVLLLFLLLTTTSSRAQLLSVDINGQTSQAAQSTTPGFVPWNMGAQTGPGIQSATQYFTNYTYTIDPDTGQLTTNINLIIPCTVTMTYPTVASSTKYLFAKNQSKKGYSTSPDPTAGWRLCIDGCMSYWKDDAITVDQPNTNGGAISLTISDLPAGVHTITTYDNNPWCPPYDNAAWHAGLTNMSRCIISVNGTPILTNTPTLGMTNDSKCGFAFFYVTNSYDGQPVVINLTPNHSSPLDFVILNGFEIDRPYPPNTAATPVSPTPSDEHVFAHNDVPLTGTANSGYLSLRWLPASAAVSNYVYFGTNNLAVANATTTSPDFMTDNAAVVGATNSFNVTNLNSRLTYYWRVDQLEVDNGVTNLVKGNVWEFRTRHLAFPGAEGYGRWARGGRGGQVIEVTNLDDSGPGSYRAAIDESGPRTIVFKVSGVIWLKSPCVINNGYVTIAGQTSPDGICIANWRAGCNSPSDVIMRYMEFRVGDHAERSMDAMSPSSAHDSIFDHLTSSWSLDVACNSLQTSKVGSGLCNCSYQYNIISEPLRYSYHYNDAERAATGCTNCYAPHAFAASIGGEIGSYHHNLIAHSTDRNWSLAGGLDQSSHYAGSMDIRNNVVYNWLGRTTDGGEARLNYVNNYYKPYYPNNPVTWLLKLDPINTNWGTEYIYMSGNVMEGKPSYYRNNWVSGSFVNGLPLTGLVVSNQELYPSYVDTQSASNAYKVVLSDVGDNKPAQDLIDQRTIGEVLNDTVHYEGTNGPSYTINGVPQDARGNDNPGFIDSQTDVHDYQSTNSALANYSPNAPWPAFDAPYNRADFLDTDHDGLPDWWELIHGTNPNSAPGDFSDSNADPDGNGYTDLEDYLNWLAGIHMDCARNSYVDMDLMQYTRGFTNDSPVYEVFSATNGTAALLPDGTTARFTPTAGFYGLAGFQFKVTDASGFSWTNNVGIHVRANAPSHLAASTSGGVPQLQLTGETGFYYLLQYSDDLIDWTTWTNTTATASAQTFTPPGFPSPTARFYRAVSVQ